MNYETTTEVCRESYGIAHGISNSVKWLLILNLVIFLVLSLGGRFDFVNVKWFFDNFGQVNSALFSKFKLWQLVTALFIHGGIAHILNNMISLWIFGTALETEWGSRPFLGFYFVCGIGAGLLQFCVDPSSSIPGVGASGAIFGLLGACGLILGNKDVYVFMAKVKLKYVVAVFTGIELYMCIMGAQDGIGHWTHISGFVIGIIYIKLKDKMLHHKASQNMINMKNRRFDNIELD